MLESDLLEYGSYSSHSLHYLVIISDLHLLGTRLGPRKTYPILIVNAHTMLVSAISTERFQPIARRNA
ncbi:hypothetical protein SBDP1_350009 [Syntrophobacter sp. SbD1]|nr:hypothetical protein SBDP1_350009 [Syntrophobacter sp. SbD1]